MIMIRLLTGGNENELTEINGVVSGRLDPGGEFGPSLARTLGKAEFVDIGAHIPVIGPPAGQFLETPELSHEIEAVAVIHLIHRHDAASASRFRLGHHLRRGSVTEDVNIRSQRNHMIEKGADQTDLIVATDERADTRQGALAVRPGAAPRGSRAPPGDQTTDGGTYPLPK